MNILDDRTAPERLLRAILAIVLVGAAALPSIVLWRGWWRSGQAIAETRETLARHAAFETGRSERTVRQHAVAVYQKSGLGGRAELAAFFLNDILLPSSTPIAADEVPV